MDIYESLLTAIYTRLTTDATLQGIMGGEVRIQPDKERPGKEFPYLMHRINKRRMADWSPQYLNRYYINIYSNSTNQEELADIEERVNQLLDGWQSSTGETSEFWLWFENSEPITEEEEDVWHRVCLYNLKHLKDAEVGVLLTR